MSLETDKNTAGDRSMDIKTPRNVTLSALYKRSFAFRTVKERMPVLLTQTVDSLVREKSKITLEYGESAKDDLKKIIGELSKLKYEIQTNKPIVPIESPGPDIQFYNDYIKKVACEEGEATHFHSIWLLTECYMYRRIRAAFENSIYLQKYDPFRSKKELSFVSSLPQMKALAAYLMEIMNNSDMPEHKIFTNLLKLSLWGNQFDLSLQMGSLENVQAKFDASSLDHNILSDDSMKTWEAISEVVDTPTSVAIILDNAGYELYTDCCLADYLVTKGLAKRIDFYVKSIPWFISDVMTHDFKWFLEQLSSDHDKFLRKLGKTWKDYFENGIFNIVENYFWTLPTDFSTMEAVCPELYHELSQAKVAIFKGDLNYRKLFCEVNWAPTTPMDIALNGFAPTKLCIIRTVKSEIICGLEPGIVDPIEKGNEKWMETGDYGVIQFFDKDCYKSCRCKTK